MNSQLQSQNAITNLGALYYEGQGVPQSYKRAAELYKQSAAQGDTYGRTNLGNMYENGRGVAQNYKEARRLFALASKQGYAEATENLKRVDELIRKNPGLRKKTKPNDPCPCKSGKKFKKCCGAN